MEAWVLPGRFSYCFNKKVTKKSHYGGIGKVLEQGLETLLARIQARMQANK